MTPITQSITALPTAPDPASDSPSNFSTKAAAFVLAQKAEAVELETFRGQVNVLASEINDAAVTAAAALAGSNFKGTYATRTGDRKSTRLNSSHIQKSRMPSSA